VSKVLFFAPHSGIWVHAFPEALVSEALVKHGHDLVYITCGKVFSQQCVVMDAARVGWQSEESQREDVCRQCVASRDLLRREFKLAGYDLGRVLDADDHNQVEDILARTTTKSFPDLVVEDVPVGKLATYELLLRHKKLSLDLNDGEWSEYQISLRYVLLSLFGARKILDRERPDYIVVYNSLYSVNRTVCMLGERRGIPHYFLHAGGNLAHRLQSLMFGRDYTFRYVKRLIEKWPEFRQLPCSPGVMRQITDHFFVLLGGSSVFTFSSGAGKSPRDLSHFFGVGAGQRVLVATMSSYDERFAAEVVGALPSDYSQLFPRQVDWIRAVVKWVSTRPDLFLIVRVHPREFPGTMRSGGKSEHARLLEQLFATLPSNVRVNWPTDEVSIYDLADIADVFLNAWSTAGKEMSLLGIPVVIYSPELVFYPSDLNYVGLTEDDYFAQIERALLDGWSLEHVRMTYRWLAVEYGQGVIDIHDGYAQREHVQPAKLSLGKQILQKIRRKVDPNSDQRGDCRRRPEVLAGGNDIDALLRRNLATPLELASRTQVSEVTPDLEDRMLRSELSRIAQVLYGSQRSAIGGKLAGRLLALGEESRDAAISIA